MKLFMLYPHCKCVECGITSLLVTADTEEQACEIAMVSTGLSCKEGKPMTWDAQEILLMENQIIFTQFAKGGRN